MSVMVGVIYRFEYIFRNEIENVSKNVSFIECRYTPMKIIIYSRLKENLIPIANYYCVKCVNRYNPQRRTHIYLYLRGLCLISSSVVLHTHIRFDWKGIQFTLDTFVKYLFKIVFRFSTIKLSNMIYEWFYILLNEQFVRNNEVISLVLLRFYVWSVF